MVSVCECERGVNILGGRELFSPVQEGVMRLNKGNNLCNWVEGKNSSWLEPISMWNNLPKEIAEASGLELSERSWGSGAPGLENAGSCASSRAMGAVRMFISTINRRFDVGREAEGEEGGKKPNNCTNYLRT